MALKEQFVKWYLSVLKRVISIQVGTSMLRHWGKPAVCWKTMGTVTQYRNPNIWLDS